MFRPHSLAAWVAALVLAGTAAGSAHAQRIVGASGLTRSPLQFNNGTTGGYGVRYTAGDNFSSGACSNVNGVQTCYSTPMVAPAFQKGGFIGQPTSGTAIPSGLFKGWQYWQATVTLELAICLIALILSAFFLSPVRRLPWGRRTPVTAAKVVP